ncbi:MAG TPA: histidine kinase [Desulfuromonadales bacterium]|nr:histidine kinase [Desulfuromonadales bacterium]
MRTRERYLILVPLCFTLLVGWFAWETYRTAPQVAAENLRGAGLSIAAAIEQLVLADTGTVALSRYSSPDIAYFSLVDRTGKIHFHTNAALIGTISPERNNADAPSGIVERRKKLGTGEEIYLLQSRIHPAGTDYQLLLALHTYRADTVIRRAHAGVSVVLFLTISLWGVTVGLLYLLRRDERLQGEMRRREELARLGEMGAVMAHEIRNPLAGIKGFAQLMESAENMDQARHYAERIVTQSQRMESLVDDLLSFAREDRGEREPTDLSMLVNDCAAMVRMEAESSGVELFHTRQPTMKIVADSDRIIQLLLNLLKNGIQAMPEGGRLHVGLDNRTSRAIISIRDSGIGISPENLPRIFEAFWSSKARGTGLGLALCRKIVQEHGGTLTVESVVGNGTIFTVTLPLAANV